MKIIRSLVLIVLLYLFYYYYYTQTQNYLCSSHKSLSQVGIEPKTYRAEGRTTTNGDVRPDK